MRGFIITGTSSGIGYELCKLLLEDPENKSYWYLQNSKY